jgi:hypothetical protein
VLVEPVLVDLAQRLAVLAHRDQELRPLALLRRGGHRCHGAQAQLVAQLGPSPPEELGGRVRRDPEDCADLLIGPVSDLAQCQDLAVARREPAVRGAHVLLNVLEQCGTLGVGLDENRAVGILGHVVGRAGSGAASHKCIALVPRRGEQIRAEVEHGCVVGPKASQDAQESLLSRIGGIIRRVQEPQAVVVDLRLVSVVERGVRGPAARGSLLDQYRVGRGGRSSVTDRDQAHKAL